MTIKPYFQPQILQIGNAIKTTLLLIFNGGVRDNHFIKRGWIRHF